MLSQVDDQPGDATGDQCQHQGCDDDASEVGHYGATQQTVITVC